MLRANHRVKISAAAGRVVIGRVEEMRRPDELPHLPGMSAEAARETLQEWGVSRVAIISYHTSPDSQFLFVALEVEGHWFDLKRNALEIEVIGSYECESVLQS
jgi:hypothetical protein